jgi:hypothetical protein
LPGLFLRMLPSFDSHIRIRISILLHSKSRNFQCCVTSIKLSSVVSWRTVWRVFRWLRVCFENPIRRDNCCRPTQFGHVWWTLGCVTESTNGWLNRHRFFYLVLDNCAWIEFCSLGRTASLNTARKNRTVKPMATPQNPNSPLRKAYDRSQPRSIPFEIGFLSSWPNRPWTILQGERQKRISVWWILWIWLELLEECSGHKSHVGQHSQSLATACVMAQRTWRHGRNVPWTRLLLIHWNYQCKPGSSHQLSELRIASERN